MQRLKREIMTISDQIEKKIKRAIYGQPQSILIQFPAGLSSVAQQEAKYILNHLWFQNKFTSEITVLKNALRIDQIHMFAIVELLMRGLCFTDIRLILCEGKVANMSAFENKCHDIPWDFYMSPTMSIKIKVDIGASPALHEGAMKEIVTHCIEDKIKIVVAGEDANETTLINVDVYKYHLVMSISLAGEPLYKRGYRSVLSHSAPLREDIAAACLQKLLQFSQFSGDSLLVPFSGTGTFLFEYWMMCYRFSPVLFERKYAIQMMPLFRSDHFNYLLKKAREYCSIEKLAPNNFLCIDNAESANNALLNNIENFKLAVERNQFVWNGGDGSQWLLSDNFLRIDVATVVENLSGNIYMPINPPYGIRFGKSNDTVLLYKQIAQQINVFSDLIKKRKTQITGFILCPSEETWSSFSMALTGATIDTYHLTQGGLDVRVAQFSL